MLKLEKAIKGEAKEELNGRFECTILNAAGGNFHKNGKTKERPD